MFDMTCTFPKKERDELRSQISDKTGLGVKNCPHVLMDRVLKSDSGDVDSIPVLVISSLCDLGPCLCFFFSSQPKSTL